MNYVVGMGAAAFVLSTIFFLWLGSMQVNAAPPPIYPYNLVPSQGNTIADLPSLLNAYFFVYVSGLLAYGWLGVLAMAGEGAKYAGLLLAKKMAVTELFFALPQLAGLAGSSMLAQAAFAGGHERKKKMVLAGALSIGGFVLLLVFHFARGTFFG